MPSDHLTTAMMVKTLKNDTLVFLDMDGFEKLVGKDVKIEYKLVESSKILLCSNCNEFNRKPKLYDISAIVSGIKFEKLKMIEYQEDQWITPASTYKMVNQNGIIETYYSNNNEMVSDSVNMKNKFLNYAIAIKVIPELTNLEELKKLID